MFRQTPESALKHRFQDNANDKLVNGIEKAAEDRNLTSEMAAWAHQFDSGATPPHMKTREFTELFPTYLFTLPEKPARARDQKQITTGSGPQSSTLSNAASAALLRP